LAPEEIEPAVLMILGRPFPRGDQRVLEISWATLVGIIKHITQINVNAFHQIFSKTGDLSSATKMTFEAGKVRRVQATLIEQPLTILEVKNLFDKIAEVSGHDSRERKAMLLETLLGKAKPIEAKYVVKITIGEMRTGFNEGLMEVAVSKAFSIPLENVKAASMLAGDVAEIASAAKSRGKESVLKVQIKMFHPIMPMMALPVEDIKQVFSEIKARTAFEFKLDGARIQIHKEGDKVRIFSRMLTEVTQSVPEIEDMIRSQVMAKSGIFDGKIIAVAKHKYPLPFQNIMRRFRRVHEIDEMVKRIQIELYFFDILFLDGQSLGKFPYTKRREILVGAVGEIPTTEQIITSDVKEAESFLDEALKSGHEGLVAKKLDSEYTPGIRSKNWFKIKRTLEPLDLVIVAADWGYGRRHSWLSDYYLGARDVETRRFVVVGKTFKGLTDEEIVGMTKSLKALAVKDEPHGVIVMPKIVVEVVYNEIQKSSKYDCGMALRFARINRIREDKTTEESDTIQRVREIYNKQFQRK
jgi:DNA ligase-1